MPTRGAIAAGLFQSFVSDDIEDSSFYVCVLQNTSSTIRAIDLSDGSYFGEQVTSFSRYGSSLVRH